MKEQDFITKRCALSRLRIHSQCDLVVKESNYFTSELGEVCTKQNINLGFGIAEDN